MGEVFEDDGVRRAKDGRFLEDSDTSLLRTNKELRKKIRESRGKMKEALLWVSELSIKDFTEICKSEELRGDLTVLQGAALQFFSQVLSSKSPAHFDTLTGFLGISTKIKNIEEPEDRDGESDDGKALIQIEFVEPNQIGT